MIRNHNYSEATMNRLVIEKPFGKDTDDCKKMMDSIARDWKEEEVYRIDHYLGMDILVSPFYNLLNLPPAHILSGEEMVRAIYHLRFANSFIEPLLNKDHVQSVSVVMKETFGAEGRGGYFDEFGMIRDVGQNREYLFQTVYRR
jgi:glucose-6-phosphate 1-dehydrogenase